jgi:hypothetical protein
MEEDLFGTTHQDMIPTESITQSILNEVTKEDRTL